MKARPYRLTAINVIGACIVSACVASVCFAQTEHGRNRQWTRLQMVELRSLTNGDASGLEVVTKAMKIAEEAATRDVEDVLHNALGAAVKRADASLCGSILTEALRNRDIRVALLPFTQDLYHKSEADGRVIDILGAIAREPEDGGTGDYQVRAVRYIENLTQDDGERRRVLLPVARISPPIRASYRAARTVAPLVNTEDVKSLRELAVTHLRKSEYHPVIEILGYQGDTAFLPHLEQALSSQDSSIPKMVRSALLKASWRIQAQNPPERLLDMIRTANPGRERDWMMERALVLGVPTDAVREAILVYAHSQVDTKAPAWQAQRARVIVCAQRLKILNPAEIESLPLVHPAP